MQPDTSVETLTLGELRDRFMEHAVRHYRNRTGEPTGEHLNMRAVLERFVAYVPGGAGADPRKINQHQVRGWQDQLAAEQLTRPYVNNCVRRLRTFLKWAAELDYVPTSVLERVRLVRPLQPFRSPAVEPVPPRPPELEVIDRILPFLPPIARDVIKLSKLSAIRPGELLGIRNAEVHLDSGGPRLTPLQHKTAHKGKHRVIPLCPEAIAIVEKHHRPLCPGDALFPSPGRGGKGKARGGHYTVGALRAAVTRACRRAGVEGFTPYDVRRAVARRVRKQHGLDAAQALLGHAEASTTEIYAPVDASQADGFAAAAAAVASLARGHA